MAKVNIKIERWKKVKLIDVLNTAIGGTPRTTKEAYWEEGKIPWLNSGALKDEYIHEPTNHITNIGFLESSVRLFPKNSILVAITGTTLGKVGFLGFASTTNQSIVGIYPSLYLESKFIFYYFLFIKSELKLKAIGAAQPHINKTVIDNIEIPIPPIIHQNRVVGILDEVFSRQRDVKSKVKSIYELEDEALRDYLMNGEEAYPGIEIKSFCIERNDRIKNDWEGKKLLGVSKELGIIELRFSEKQNFEKYKIVYPGDFIYNPMRINIGSIGIYSGDTIALTSPDYIVFYTNHTLSKRLLLKFLKSTEGKSAIDRNTRGSVRSRLYFNSLSQIKIPFCGSDCQAEAEATFEYFQKLRTENNTLVKQLEKIVIKILDDCFNQRIIFNDTIEETSDELISLMKNEKRDTESISKHQQLLTFESVNIESKKDSVAKGAFELKMSTEQISPIKSLDESITITTGMHMAKIDINEKQVRELIIKNYSSETFTSTDLIKNLSIGKDDYDVFKDVLFSLLQDKVNETESTPFLIAIYDEDSHEQLLKIKK